MIQYYVLPNGQYVPCIESDFKSRFIHQLEKNWEETKNEIKQTKQFNNINMHMFDHVSLLNPNGCITDKESKNIKNILNQITKYIKENNIKIYKNGMF